MDRDDGIGVVRRIYEDGYNRGIESVFDECYTPDFQHHSKVIFDVPPAGEGEKQSMRRFRAAIPDVSFEILEMLADGDRVVVRLNIRGTPQGSYGRIEPGGTFSSHALVLFRVEDGRVAEEWLFVDGGS
jgi:ketosteroid isomerase-like protein